MLKASFHEIYNAPTPRPYMRAMNDLHYCTPAHAAPLIRRCLQLLREHEERPLLLDICCGYALNSALLRCALDLDGLYDHFSSGGFDLATDLAHDRRFIESRRRADADGVVVFGLDVADRALAWGKHVGLFDHTLAIDLESEDFTSEQRLMVARASLITVTGGLSYIGEASFERLLDACAGERAQLPWVLYYPLRHTDMRGLNAVLARHGLVVEVDRRRGLPHRRFADAEEKERLIGHIDPAFDPVVADPSHHHIETVVHLARPPSAVAELPFAALLASDEDPPSPVG